jgi:hypothetical protein
VRWLVALVVLLVLPLLLPSFLVVVLTEIAIVALFATAFNLLMGFGGMVSFGHAAYFALGAYAAALLVKQAAWPMPLALRRFPVRGGRRGPVLRLLHRAPHAHVFRDALAGLRPDRLHGDLQVEGLTGGDDGILNLWPPPALKSPLAYCYFTLAVAGRGCSPCAPSSTRRSATRSGRFARTRARPLHRRECPPPPALRVRFVRLLLRLAGASSRSSTAACSPTSRT